MPRANDIPFEVVLSSLSRWSWWWPVPVHWWTRGNRLRCCARPLLPLAPSYNLTLGEGSTFSFKDKSWGTLLALRQQFTVLLTLALLLPMKLIFLIFFLTEKSQPWWNSIFQLFLFKNSFQVLFIFGYFGTFFWAHLSVFIFSVKIVINILILSRFHCFQKRSNLGRGFFPALILLVEN